MVAKLRMNPGCSTSHYLQTQGCTKGLVLMQHELTILQNAKQQKLLMLSKLKCLKTMTQFHRGQHVNTDRKSFEPWSSACQQPTPSKSLVYKHKTINILNFVNTQFILSIILCTVYSFIQFYLSILSIILCTVYSFIQFIYSSVVLSFHDNIFNVVMFILLQYL